VIKKTQTLAYEQLAAARGQPVKTSRFEESQPFEHQWRKGECPARAQHHTREAGAPSWHPHWTSRREKQSERKPYIRWIWLHSHQGDGNRSGDLRSEKWWGSYGLGSRNAGREGLKAPVMQAEFQSGTWCWSSSVFCSTREKYTAYCISFWDSCFLKNTQ